MGGSGLDGSLNFSRSQEVAPPGPQQARPPSVKVKVKVRKVTLQIQFFSTFPYIQSALTSSVALPGPQAWRPSVKVIEVMLQHTIGFQLPHNATSCLALTS